MSPEFRVVIPGDTPPSFNAVGHSGSRWKWTAAKKDWQQRMEVAFIAAGVPREAAQRVEMRAELWFPTRVRRDTVNYRTLLEKCAGDALVNGRWLPDDTPEFFSFGAIAFHHGDKRTELVLDITPAGLQGRSQAAPTPPRRFRRAPKG